ncbi:MAG: hypothetical protein GY827_00115 [Cytophagales bacterium]|nr:hypothetical protein [Cytophagales bacterium]
MKKNIKHTIVAGLGLLSSLTSMGQIEEGSFGYYQDALTYSQTFFGGTARMRSMAGAQASLGADASAPLSNPAGLALYRKSSLVISPTLQMGSSSSVFRSEVDDQTSLNNKDNFNLGNIAFVFAKANENNPDWKSHSFSVSYNRINNFHSRVSYDGTSDNSLSDYLVETGNNTNDPLDFITDGDGNLEQAFSYVGMGYATYAVDQDDQGFYHYNESGGINVEQEEYIVTRGAINQWDFGFGANYQNKIFLGGSIGVPTINRKQNKSYQETFIDTQDNNTEVNTVNLEENLQVRGTGINAKLGIIYRIDNMFRLGLSAETPTYYSINEESNAELSNNFFVDFTDDSNNLVIASGDLYEIPLVTNTFSYTLRTPYHVNGGLSVFFGKKGFISGDVELVGYDRMRVSSNDVNFNDDNETITNLYQRALNYRIGGEFRHERLRLRAGYAYYGNPIRDSENNINLARQFITGGIGIKFPKYFFDLAVVYQTYDEGYTRYSLSNGTEPTIVSELSNTQITLSVGRKF